MTAIDTTTGLPYTGDALRGTSDSSGGIPGRSIGRCGVSGFAADKAPGAPAVVFTPSIDPRENAPGPATVYTPPLTLRGTSAVYVTPLSFAGPLRQYTPPEATWIHGVPNVVTGVTALALGYALYKTFVAPESPRSNPTHWVKGAVYRTSYGTARVIKLEGDGTFATFRIESPTREASGMGWRQGDTFGANVNDNSSPSPSTWKRIDTRTNPNNRGRPTLKEVEEAFGDWLRHEYGDRAKARAKEVHRALNSGGHTDLALQDVDTIIRGHGVERFPPNSDDPAAFYINTGDLYNMTAIYDVKRRAYILTDMGTWRSENESENES